MYLSCMVQWMHRSICYCDNCSNERVHNNINSCETGYSVVRSLSEAPQYASVIANILKQSNVKNMLVGSRISENISMQGKWCMSSNIHIMNHCFHVMKIWCLCSAWNALWPQERKRQRAFFLFGLALILQLDIEGIRTFFCSFFRLPKWYVHENIECYDAP